MLLISYLLKRKKKKFSYCTSLFIDLTKGLLHTLQLQLNMHNHVLALCAFCKALSVSLPDSMSSTLSTTIPMELGHCTCSFSEAENG
jgi:hypothetical protein